MKKITLIGLLFVATLFVSCGGGGGGGNDDLLPVNPAQQPTSGPQDNDNTQTSDINPADYIVPNKVEAIKVE